MSLRPIQRDENAVAASYHHQVWERRGREESAGKSYSQRSAKGNWQMRRVLNQVAHAAALKKGSFFQSLYRRLVPRLGPQKAIWAVAHRICRLVWKIPHEGVSYREQSAAPTDPKTIRRKQRRVAAEFRRLCYLVQYLPIPPATT